MSIKLWREKERLDGEIVDCLTVILRTRGCGWDKCYMCGYTNEAYPADREELIQQVDYAFKKLEGEQVLKVFTSGSFFDDREVMPEVREYLLDKFRQHGLKKLIVESRPEYIEEEKLEPFRGINLEVGIGLETADDEVRELCINKGFSFDDFKSAAAKLRKSGFRVKCYLLLKPPFLSEGEAIEDAVKSIIAAKDYTDIFSLNLTNVQKGTLVERLWKAKLYRPPWLWSAVKVLKEAKKIGVEIVSDPVAAGRKRGPHNCGKCDKEVARAIKEFSLTQDAAVLQLSCDCMLKWKKAVKLENYSRIPLF